MWRTWCTLVGLEGLLVVEEQRRQEELVVVAALAAVVMPQVVAVAAQGTGTALDIAEEVVVDAVGSTLQEVHLIVVGEGSYQKAPAAAAAVVEDSRCRRCRCHCTTAAAVEVAADTMVQASDHPRVRDPAHFLHLQRR